MLVEIRHYMDVPLEDAGEESRGLRVRWVLGPKTGPKKCYMRIFELEPEGHSPLHSHPGEHSIIVLEGRGTAAGEDGEAPIAGGSCIHVPGGKTHQIRNTGPNPMVFVCVLSSG